VEAGRVTFPVSRLVCDVERFPSFATVHRDLIITLATRYQLPAVYPNRFFATGGGLMSYGPDFVDQFRAIGGVLARP
jgi:hypothetical protein